MAMIIAVAIIIIVMPPAAIHASHDHDGHDADFNEHCDEDGDRDCRNDDPHRDRHDGHSGHADRAAPRWS